MQTFQSSRWLCFLRMHEAMRASSSAIRWIANLRG